jgi:hypothetical protein
METLITLIVLVLLCLWIYRAGKSIGSRKGYGVGRRHGRRWR